MALPVEGLGLKLLSPPALPDSISDYVEKIMADTAKTMALPPRYFSASDGCFPPGSVVKMDDTPYWHGQKPFVTLNTSEWPSWEEIGEPGQKISYAHVSEPGTIILRPPDHRYDRILEEFGAKTVHVATPAPEEPLVWTPPPGAFPEPDPETVLEFPKGDEWVREIGRWKCSVVVKVKSVPQQITTNYPKFWIEKEDKMWLQAEPREDSNLPTYQRWAKTDDERELNRIFVDWLTEIEANPECCVRHKLIGRYDDTECVGQRSEKPPVGLIPEEKSTGWFSIGDLTKAYNQAWVGGASNLFNPSPVFKRLSSGGAAGQVLGGSNITVSSPRTGFKLHGVFDEP